MMALTPIQEHLAVRIVKHVRECNLGIVNIAAVNSSSQVVVSGQESAVEKVVEIAKSGELGSRIRKATQLRVNRAFHSDMLTEARETFQYCLQDSLHLCPGTDEKPVRVVSSVTGKLESISDEQTLRELLTRQITEPVLWYSACSEIERMAVETVVEVGGGGFNASNIPTSW
jgi:[acyl-carrier-protein] S-malonyltransferase